MGDHEQLHRDLEIPHDEPRGRRAGYRRSFACHRARPRGSDSGRCYLQHVLAPDRRLPRAPVRHIGGSPSACQPRPGSRPADAQVCPCSRRVAVMSVRLDHGKDELEEVHEINVTPFIDVILVLLIIFMIAAPLATVDISVDLPSSTAQPQPRPDKPLYLTVKPDLSLSVGETSVPRGQLASLLEQTTNGDKQTRIFLRADKAVPYGELMEVMNLLRAAGFLKIALVGLEK